MWRGSQKGAYIIEWDNVTKGHITKETLNLSPVSSLVLFFFAATQFSIPNPHNSLLLHISARICTRNMGHIQQSKLGGEMWATKQSLNLKAARCILPRQYFSVKLEISNLLIFRCWKDMENIRCHAKFIYIFIVYKILQLLKLVLYEGNLNTTGHGNTLISKAVGILY